MSLKTFLMRILVPLSPRRTGLGAARRARLGGFAVEPLKPSLPLTETEKAERYRTGRFAEMTDTQAGL